MTRPVPILVGPTSSGKTALSLLLSRRMRCEIISADSRQIYRRMDIGTAKPSPSERERVRHHCIDILDPDEDFSAGQYGPLARRLVHDIDSRGLVPLVVGGSGLYIRALVDGIFEGGFRDEATRKQLKEEAEAEGPEVLHHRLEFLDPEAAARIHPNDGKRIIRALEVRSLSGVPLSKLQREGTIRADFPTRLFGLDWPRDLLYGRIEGRVDDMLRGGLIQEVQDLVSSGYSLGNNALDAVGYKEILMHLDGTLELEAAADLIKKNTRRFAKRQMTWFRGDPRIRWFHVRSAEELSDVAERIADDLSPG
jgi:tRNA dimethylallyltransferase